MKTLKFIHLITICVFSIAGRAAQSLSMQARIKSSPAVLAPILAIVGVHNLSATELSAFMVQIFGQHDSIANFARKSECAAFADSEQLNTLAKKGGGLQPGTCYCTDNAQIFNEWMVPAFEATTKFSTAAFYARHSAQFASNTLAAQIDPNGTIKGGLFGRDKTGRMKFRIWVNGVERGQKAQQHYCNFKGKFHLYTSTIEGNFIEVDLQALGPLLLSGQDIPLSIVQVQNGVVTARR